MAVVATRDELLALVRKSQLVAPARLEAFLHDCPALPDDPLPLAGALRKAGLLTRYQADHLLRGCYKGFDLGKYRILQAVGSGAMGLVYLCEHRAMGHRVAVKVLPKRAIQQDALALARFKREARAAAALSHPNIVRTLDIDEANGYHFLVMEYVEGRTLLDLVEAEGPLPVESAVRYAIQTALGLQHIGESGLVHRDLKPANLLLDKTGTIKIHDLGLALFTDDRRDNLTQNANAGTILGTVDFLSPEQATHSSDVDIRTDIYGLGATLYFVLAGQAPFGDLPLTRKLLAVHTVEPKPLGDHSPRIPPALSKVVARMMAKDAADRYQTPLEAAHALAPFLPVPIDLPPLDDAPGPTTKKATGRAPLDTSKVRAGMKTPADLPLQVPPPKPGAGTGGTAWLREHPRAALGAAAGLVALLVLGSLVLPQLLPPRAVTGAGAGGQTTVPEAAPNGIGR
jgi:serine/threonine protein kinase